MRLLSCLLLLMAHVSSALAQLTPEQRVHDFTNLAGLYAKRYAPYEWKRQLSGFDLFDLRPWLERVRTAPDDLAFLEIQAEYVASLDDGHSSFIFPSSFYADLGFTVDLYDGRVLVDSINRLRLPVVQFPFQIGDELVLFDGQTPEQLITEFSRLRRRGSLGTTRRAAADLITFRPQSTIARAVELGDTARVVIRRASGVDEAFTMLWNKTGFPVPQLGPVPSPLMRGTGGRAATARRADPESNVPDYLQPLFAGWNWSMPQDDHLLAGSTWSEQDGMVPRRYALGIGASTPIFASGFPASFVRRLANPITEFHYSGVYESEGLRIGYLRIPRFSVNSPLVLSELDREISYLQQNTDGLVVDVMRNPGGGCYTLDVARRLIPHEFSFFGEEIRPTLDRINNLESGLRFARLRNADQWVIDLYESYLNQLTTAYRENRGRTGNVPACSAFPYTDPPSLSHQPAPNAYAKPLIVLIDEFSVSAADIFPAMLQDNRRGPLVGTRTSGAGGSISSWPSGFYSEGIASNTNSLVVRPRPVTVPGYPATSYLENVGAHADIPLDYMTRENLMNGGRPFVEAFTRILVDQIRAARQ